jgi:hypothetical protein
MCESMSAYFSHSSNNLCEYMNGLRLIEFSFV